MNASPLYLISKSPGTLGLDAVQRLCIDLAGQRTRRIPMHMVSRIVCSTQVAISANALLGCMRRGIPLSIVEPNGTTVGWCMGVRRTENSLRLLLSNALNDPAWDELYNPWLETQRLAIAAQVLLLCDVRADAAARRDPRTALCNAHKNKHARPCGDHVNAIAELARQELAAHLAREIPDPTLLAWHRPGLNLIADLGDLLAHHAHTDLHHASVLPEPKQLGSWAMRNYERQASHWQYRIASVMQPFEQFLREYWL